MIAKAKRVIDDALKDGAMVGVSLAKDVLAVMPEHIAVERKKLLGEPVDPDEDRQDAARYAGFHRREYLDPNHEPAKAGGPTT